MTRPTPDRDALARLMRVTDSTNPEQQARFGRWWDDPENRNPEIEAHAYLRADAVLTLLSSGQRDLVGPSVTTEQWAQVSDAVGAYGDAREEDAGTLSLDSTLERIRAVLGVRFTAVEQAAQQSPDSEQ